MRQAMHMLAYRENKHYAFELDWEKGWAAGAHIEPVDTGTMIVAQLWRFSITLIIKH